jgi:chaperonin GroES
MPKHAAPSRHPKLEPLNDYVAVRRLVPKVAGHLVMPDVAAKQSNRAVVIAVGPGRVLPDGTRTDCEVVEGEIVLLPHYCGTEIQVDGIEGPLLIVRAVEIICTVQGE